MAARIPPKAMAKKLLRLLCRQHPDYHYLKKVFQHTRERLEVGAAPPAQRMPELSTDAELVAFYEAVWHARQLPHVVMRKLLLVTGIRHAELVQLRLTEGGIEACHIRSNQGKGQKERDVLLPASSRGELAQYMPRQQSQGATYLFASNRQRPYSTRRMRQLVKHDAAAAGIDKRVDPHLLRHQFITYLTKQSSISPKLQLLSGHAVEQNLAVCRELALSDVAENMKRRCAPLRCDKGLMASYRTFSPVGPYPTRSPTYASGRRVGPSASRRVKGLGNGAVSIDSRRRRGCG